jgi:ubiquinone/menaquinone biosynthesis C-methylase UbiE
MSQSTSWYRGDNVAQSLGENYDRYLVPTIFGPWAVDLVALAAPQPDERILDVACGTGAVAREAVRALGAEGRVTGLDLNAGMLNIARAHDLQGIVQWREGSVQAMPFPDEVFTLVLCQQGMQYFPDRAAALREMYRVLASDGRLVLNIWRAIERTPGFLVLSQALGRHISPEAGVLPPFALGDAVGLAAEVATAGFHDVTTQIASRRLRYGSPEEFVRTYIISTPLVNLLTQVEEERYAALLAEVSTALQPYIDDTGLVFPIEGQIILARK